MGTIATLSTFGRSRGEGLTRLEAMLRVLEATEAQLSTWKPDTHLARINALPPDTTLALAPELCSLFGQIRHWHHDTGGAFDPGIGQLLAVYGFRSQARRPSPQELRHALDRSGLHRFAFDPASCTIVRHKDARLEEGAFGKGESLDRVRASLDTATGAWMIDLGGQVAVGGRTPSGSGWPVVIADPRDRQRALLTISMTHGSLATSGGSERDAVVDGERVGHILDPRTGRPADYDGSVSVWHERALVADILSTALYVMGPELGLRWADARGVAVCFLGPSVPAADGMTISQSRAWKERFTTPASSE